MKRPRSDLRELTKVMLQKREDDKRELEERFVANIKTMILPYTEKLKGIHLDQSRGPT